MSPWSIEQNSAGRSTVKHHAAPRFSAEWTTGEADLTAIDGLFWQDDGSGDDDRLTLHGFQWIDNPPDQATFERLMKQAALFIDDWIAQRI
jgi:hypothetical protein